MVEMARSCLKQTKMPSVMWTKAVRHSVYILNRLTTRALSGQTAYEVWTGSKLYVSRIRIFGCLEQIKVPGTKQSKLDNRSMRVVNLCKEPGTNAYRLYSPGDNKVYVSRDVKFEEDKIWSWDNQEGTDADLGSTFSVLEADSVGEIGHAGSSDTVVNDAGEEGL